MSRRRKHRLTAYRLRCYEQSRIDAFKYKDHQIHGLHEHCVLIEDDNLWPTSPHDRSESSSQMRCSLTNCLTR